MQMALEKPRLKEWNVLDDSEETKTEGMKHADETGEAKAEGMKHTDGSGETKLG